MSNIFSSVKNLLRLSAMAALVAGSAYYTGLAGPASAGAEQAQKQSSQKKASQSVQWDKRVTISSQGGHILGNPIAKKRVVEYMSYTCPHCAHFEQQSSQALRRKYIASGEVSLEVRNLIRDPVDATVALLARCGDKNSFFRNHKALLASQPVWLGKVQKAGQATYRKWSQGSVNERLLMIASDIGLYDEMAKLGISRASAQQCLTSKAEQDKIMDMTRHATNVEKIEGTPGFTMNGKLLKDVYDWAALESSIRAR